VQRLFLRELLLLRRQATWLIPEGLHSCGTAPDSNRTSLLAPRGTTAVRIDHNKGSDAPICTYTRDMDRIVKNSLAALALLVATALLYRRRPVSRPVPDGQWHPVDR